MTLREYGQSIVEWWDAYLTEITTKKVLDWSVSHLILTAVAGFIGLGVVIGLVEIVMSPVMDWLARTWQRTGIPQTVERMEKRFGPILSGLIMIFGITVILGVVIVFLIEVMDQ